MSDIKPFEQKMEKTIENFQNDLATLRAGRANPRVLDKITVDYYGTSTPVNQVGNVTVPEARVIQIAPWEQNMLKEIEKSIMASDLGINPSNDGKVIRLIFPQLTEERRKALTKDVKKKGEDAKVAIRNIRREAMDSFKKMTKDKSATEDDVKKLEEQTQKLTDKVIGQIDKIVEEKNKDILSI
ncbi:MAG: ribosome recycling factor [Defluviitaleaceae bacterium]|nr:ribosome recycling factor [Defluviitaleaceae bacterium]